MLTNQTIQIQAVLFHNNKNALTKALDSYANAFQYDQNNETILSSLNVLWGDAAPEPLFSKEEVEKLKSKYQSYFQLDYIFFDENTGYGKGHNLLSEYANADFIMPVNPDIIITADYFSIMLSPFEDSTVGITEARQTPLEHPKKYDPITLETPWSSGACFIIPTALFHELNGFDAQNFFMYYEDVDLSWRVRNAGYKLLYQPNAPVYHSKKLDCKGNLMHSNSELRHSPESSMIFAFKWHLDGWLRDLITIYQIGTDAQQEALQSFLTKKKNHQLYQMNNTIMDFQADDLTNRYEF